jgi:uncharacterized protein (DUF2062 family)
LVDSFIASAPVAATARLPIVSAADGGMVFLRKTPVPERDGGGRAAGSISAMVRKRLKRWLPTEEKLREKPSLRWLGPLLRRPWLWHLSRRSVAAGAAIGVFFGFMIPVLQIGFAAVVAVMLRANLPVAAVTTLVSNPLTYVPIFVLAYKTGSALLGEPVDAAKAAALAAVAGEDAADANGWRRQVLDIGKPLFVGLAVFASLGAAITWVTVNLLWTLAVKLRRRRVLARGQAPPD